MSEQEKDMTEAMCKCIDCQSNSDGMCIAPEIELDYGENGGCECLSYMPVGDMGMPAEEGGLLENEVMMEQ